MTELKINLDQIKMLSSDSSTFAREMIDLYLDQTKNQLKKIEASISKNDYNAVGRVAHSMKASFAIINCDILSTLSTSIEEECNKKTPNVDIIGNYLQKFIPLVEQSFPLIVEIGKHEKLI